MDGITTDTGEEFVRVRSPNSTKAQRRRKFVFVCPACGWKLQAALAQEVTLVRCECNHEFIVRKPVAKPPARVPDAIRPPLRSILQSRSRGDSTSDSGSHVSNVSRSEQSVIVSQHSSSASSVVLSANASGHSMDSSVEWHAMGGAVERATRLGSQPQSAKDENNGGATSQAPATAASVDADSSSNGAGRALNSILEGGGWLGQMFSASASFNVESGHMKRSAGDS